VLGSALVVKAAPLGLVVSAPDRSAIERVGCRGTGDNCRIGMFRMRHESGRWSCVPCGPQRYGEDRYYEPRRYREDEDRYYEPRRYREDEDGYYEPRRYPREYY